MNITGKSSKPKRNLRELLDVIAVRGECTCGQCKNGEHTADLVFMKVSIDKWSSNAQFRKLVSVEYPKLLNSKVKSLREVTEIVGDQEFALIMMGVGKLLGIWELKTPDDLVTKSQRLDQKQRVQLAQSGHLTIHVPRKKVFGSVHNKTRGVAQR